MCDGRILVVEDRDTLRRMIERALGQEGYDVVAVETGDAGLREAERDGYDLILTDLKLPGATGIDILKVSRQAHPGVPVVVLTGYGTVHTAVEAMKLGAADFLEKPVDIDDLFELTRSLISDQVGDFEFVAPGDSVTIIGGHPKMKAALRLLKRVAGTDATVLLTGESGTGKEVFARALHALSKRSKGPFVAVNCAAIPETLIENELFGHEKGAFTGAHRRQVGRVEMAASGTLLLDEIAELSLATQAKILRLLEEKTFERVGSGRMLRADVRVVAATNRDLRQMVDTGGFRQDLFYRLDVFPLELPPLRDRVSDIPALCRYLFEGLASRQGTQAPTLSVDALRLLERQEWPGNVRQLANLLERALILVDSIKIGAADLEPLLSLHREEGEEKAIRRALRNTAGDKKATAELMGMSYRTLLRRIQQYDLGGFPAYRE